MSYNDYVEIVALLMSFSATVVEIIQYYFFNNITSEILSEALK